MSVKPTYEELEERISMLEETISKYQESDGKILAKDSLFDTLFEMSPFSMWISDNSGTVIHANRSLCDTIKLNHDDIVGKYNVLEDDNLEISGVMSKVRDVFEKHEPARFNIFWKADLVRDVDFTRARNMFIDVSMHPIVDENDQLKNVFCQWVDITDFKKTEAELKESEAKWRSYIENAPFGVFIANKDGFYKEINPAAADITGYSEQELLRKSIPDLLAPESIEDGKKHFRQLQDEGHISGELAFIHKNGEKRSWTVSAVKLNEDNYIGFTEDITSRLEMESALKENEERFTLAMEFANVGLFDWDLENNEIYYSPVWKGMLGYRDDELPNDFSVWESLTEPKDVKRSWEMQNELINKKCDNFEIEFKMRHKEGYWVDIFSRANAIFDENDKAIRIIGTHVDITERKNAQLAIQKSEQKYKHLIQTTSDAIYLITEDGRFSDVNPAACSMLNRSSEEILNMDISAIDPNFSAELFLNFWKETPLNEPRVFETAHLHKDGSLVPVEVNGQKFQVGEDVFYFGIARNIADRKKAEAHLRKSQLMIESTSDAIISTDVNGIITFWNSGAESLYGYTCEEVLNKPITIIYKEDDLPVLQQLIANLIQGKDLSNEKLTCIDKEGNDVEILLSLTTIKDEKQNVIELVGFTKDISELKRYEKEIMKQKESAEQYLNLAGVIFVAINQNGEVTLINKKGCETLGCNYSEVIGKKWFESFIPECLRDDLLSISKQLLNGEIEPAEYYENPILTKNGEEKLIAWHNTILKDEKGEIIGHLSAGDDITKKRQMEEQLLQAQKMESIGTLAGGIAHEFNNILSIIIGNNELIMEDLPEWSISRQNCEEIRVAGIRARDIVKHLLTFSRQDDSRKKPISMASVTMEALKLIRSTTPSNINIINNISLDCLPIFGDPTQINQILINLCSNAIDALPISGGMINVELSNVELENQNNLSTSAPLPGKYIRLLVRDNGCGMDPKTVERVFEPYFTTKDVGKGSGIGLAVVHGIIENHGGSIVCESAQGKGTTFTILLPAYEGLVEEERGQAKPFPGKGESVLYVDDEPAIAKLGKRHLEALGYDVFSTTDPEEALTIIKAEPDRFDLVISDMAMPNMPGDQLISEILSINPNIPTIICSGYTSRMSETKAFEMGIKSFVMKPLNKNELAKKVREVLDS